jgi:small subunit ribosomal protein S4
VVQIRDKSKSLQRFKDVLDVTASRIMPEWLSVEHDQLRGVVNAVPTREQINIPVRETMIVELYSK